MRKCWGKRAAVVTALPKNDLGWLVEDFIMQGGVDMSHVIWREFDGLGKNTRVGLNFTEKGFGIRPALGCSDRGHSAASQIKPGEVNWEKLFGEEGVRWFHTGGIFAALAIEHVGSGARGGGSREEVRHGGCVRPQLPRVALEEPGRQGRRAEASTATSRKYVDVMIGNEEDFTACLGFEVEGADEHLTNIETESFKKMIQTAVAAFPNFKVAATTLRKATTATFNDWAALLYYEGEVYQSMQRATTWRSTTASAAATASRRDSRMDSSKGRARRPRWSTARRTARWR